MVRIKILQGIGAFLRWLWLGRKPYLQNLIDEENDLDTVIGLIAILLFWLIVFLALMKF